MDTSEFGSESHLNLNLYIHNGFRQARFWSLISFLPYLCFTSICIPWRVWRSHPHPITDLLPVRQWLSVLSQRWADLSPPTESHHRRHKSVWGSETNRPIVQWFHMPAWEKSERERTLSKHTQSTEEHETQANELCTEWDLISVRVNTKAAASLKPAHYTDIRRSVLSVWSLSLCFCLDKKMIQTQWLSTVSQQTQKNPILITLLRSMTVKN